MITDKLPPKKPPRLRKTLGCYYYDCLRTQHNGKTNDGIPTRWLCGIHSLPRLNDRRAGAGLERAARFWLRFEAIRGPGVRCSLTRVIALGMLHDSLASVHGLQPAPLLMEATGGKSFIEPFGFLSLEQSAYPLRGRGGKCDGKCDGKCSGQHTAQVSSYISNE